MNWFIEHLIVALDDPRTHLVLLLALWAPSTAVLLVLLVAAVYVLTRMTRTVEPATTV